jgi:LysM repeat protein
VEDIKSVNPVYKLSFIPETNPKQCIYGPIQYIGKLVSLEDSLYRLEESIYNAPKTTPIVVPTPVDTTSVAAGDSAKVEVTTPGATPAGNTFYHKVQAGENLGNIATKYGTTVNKIMTLNGMNSTHIYVGQRLKIESTKPGAGDSTPVATPNTQSTQVKYYTVQTGDTFGKIAQRHGKSISQLRQLNPGINIERLRLGQRLRVR